MFSHLNTKEKMNTCLGIMKLWLNFQESLAAVIEPNASSQESWCAHIRGESVWDARDKERPQAQKGQRGCSESGTRLLCWWNWVSCQRDYSKKQSEMNVSLNETRPPWHFVHSELTDVDELWSGQAIPKKKSILKKSSQNWKMVVKWKLIFKRKPRSEMYLSAVFFLIPFPLLSSFSVSDTATQTQLWTWLKGKITLHI